MQDTIELTDSALQRLAARLGDRCLGAGLRLGCAESCTGGWIGKLLTDVAGSSAWFEGGVISYSNALKSRLLDVPAELIAADGAVSASVATAMARGACRLLQVDLAVAVTGIAGPDGGSVAKPVGTVFLAVASADGRLSVREERFSGDREAVRRATVGAALQMLLEAAS